MNNISTNNLHQGSASEWCSLGRTPKSINGICYCDYPQYSVKQTCLPQKPACYQNELDNGYTYYGQNTGNYITHGKHRIES